MLHSKVSQPDEDSYEYYKGQKSMEIIKNFIGKEINIEDIPCVKYSDSNTDLPAYSIEKDAIKLVSRVRSGRLLGNYIYKTQLLAKIYIAGSNNRK